MFRLEWFGLAVLVALTVWSREPARQQSQRDDAPELTTHCGFSRMTPERRRAIDLQRERANALRVADQHYRDGEPALAAHTIHQANLMFDTELQSLAQLYWAFADESATIASPTAPVIDVFVALRRAQALDMALGGAFADRLNARMREVAPEAAAAYERAHDRTGADLAKHTAELFK
jgi:hypothetical protein